MAAIESCSVRNMEPVVRVPKSVLVTAYGVKDSAEKFLLFNLHIINFTLDYDLYRKQLQVIVKIVKEHAGPYVIAGDFNSWNRMREEILFEVMSDLRAKTVDMKVDDRSKFFGRAVDYIFYSELELLGSSAERVRSSDHNPVIASFRLLKRIW